MQRIFFWAMSLWLALCVGLVVWLTPWLRGVLFPLLTAGGLLLLAGGIVCLLRDVWSLPPPRAIFRRLLVIVPALLVTAAIVPWLAIRRVAMHGWFGTKGYWDIIPDFGAIQIYKGNLADFFEDEQLWVQMFLPVAETPFSRWLAAGLGALAVALLLAYGLWFYHVLRRRWQPPLRPGATIVRWLVMLAVAAAIVLGLDAYGFESVRRAISVVHVALNSASLLQGGPTATPIELKPSTSAFEVTEPMSGPSYEPPGPTQGACYIFNGWRFIVGPEFGTGYLCRAVDDSMPTTEWRLLDYRGALAETIKEVAFECTYPPRRVYGPWYEVGDSNIFLHRENWVLVKNEGHLKNLGQCRPF